MLRILTFNISGSNVSAHAPAGFGLLAKVQAVTDLVAQHQPHLLALQEVDAESPHIAEELAALLASLPAGGGYTLAASTPSHCGLSQVYAQAALRPSCGTAVGPVALCRIPLPLPSLAGGGGSAEDVGLATEEAVPAKEAAAGGAADQLSCFYFAGCHLEPFADGAEERLLQIRAVLRAVPQDAGLVLAGDMNMRVKENAAVEALGLSEAFMQAGQPRQHSYPWNSRINRYYGADSREYVARYDRVYLRGFQATSLRLVADEPVGKRGGHFLSDHFGVLTEVRPVATAAPHVAGSAAAPASRKRRLSPSAGRAPPVGPVARVLPL